MRLELLLALLPLVLGAPVIYPRAGQAIPGQYIVKFKNDAVESAVETAISHLTKGTKHKYSIAGFKGFSAEINDDVLKILQALPGV